MPLRRAWRDPPKKNDWAQMTYRRERDFNDNGSKEDIIRGR
jgi:hypothetical protein